MPTYIHDKQKILIVEDDSVARSFLEEYLEPIGESSVALSGQEALSMVSSAMAEQDPYSLICLDIGLPDLSGTAVLTEIRNREKQLRADKKDRVKIVMTTAAGALKDVLKAMQLGCDGYVVKPFTRDLLYAELNKCGVNMEW